MTHVFYEHGVYGIQLQHCDMMLHAILMKIIIQNKETPGGDIGDITGIVGPETGHFLS